MSDSDKSAGPPPLVDDSVSEEEDALPRIIPLRVGEQVRIVDLVAGASLNGRYGKLVEYVVERGRWSVQVEGRERPIGLLEANLIRDSATPSGSSESGPDD
jgi:hypothetical protein